jgi:hypothetical protein
MKTILVILITLNCSLFGLSKTSASKARGTVQCASYDFSGRSNGEGPTKHIFPFMPKLLMTRLNFPLYQYRLDISSVFKVCTDKNNTAWKCGACTGSISKQYSNLFSSLRLVWFLQVLILGVWLSAAHGCRLSGNEQQDPDSVDCQVSFSLVEANDKKKSRKLMASKQRSRKLAIVWSWHDRL